MASPSIASIGIIGKHNNPLHIGLFPPTTRPALKFHFLLNSCLDIFEARMPNKTVDQDFGLLHAVDERLAMYGYLTNTGVKFVVVVDMMGREAPKGEEGTGAGGVLGVRDSDLKPVFKAIQTAYVRLLQNPFYTPDDHNPKSADGQRFRNSTQITSRNFIEEIRRIAEAWTPGITEL